MAPEAVSETVLPSWPPCVVTVSMSQARGMPWTSARNAVTLGVGAADRDRHGMLARFPPLPADAHRAGAGGPVLGGGGSRQPPRQVALRRSPRQRSATRSVGTPFSKESTVTPACAGGRTDLVQRRGDLGGGREVAAKLGELRRCAPAGRRWMAWS